ncbi:Uncharacterised protein [Mycobacteroides abscessus subsp. abscessus]|nr:Uncharacterised protein [Mycobacteroides abscessus subsp. abscessus]
MGTRDCVSRIPLGRVRPRTVVPTGSGMSMTCSTESAIAAIRASSRRRRSRSDSLIPFSAPLARSLSLALTMRAEDSRSPSAIACSAASFSAVEVVARRAAAAFAFCAILVTPRTVLGWMSAAAVMD